MTEHNQQVPPADYENPGMIDRFNRWVSESMSLRLVIIGFLILILLIPLGMIQDLISERMYRLDDAKSEVSRLWAGDQHISGPYIAIPYTIYDNNGNASSGGQLHILPERLTFDSEVMPEIRKRGIFEIPVYQSTNAIKFSFNAIAVEERPDRKVHWESARLCMGLSDTRGVTNELLLMINGNSVAFNPGIPEGSLFTSGVSVPIPMSIGDSGVQAFGGEVDLTLRGSNMLYFLPLGKTTDVNLQSSWQHPSFDGSFIPVAHEITNDGFTASWKVLHYNRNFPQAFFGDQDVQSSAFGVKLFMPVNHYQKSERSAKYGVLMIALTFILLFFSQAINHVRIHPFQYFLVGLALSLFYTLLLSMSEHIGFNMSYVIAALMVLILVILYLRKVSGDWKYPSITAGVLAGLYTYIFTLLQLEDFALLIGSIGLFIILAVIMWLSTKIDWNGLPAPAATQWKQAE